MEVTASHPDTEGNASTRGFGEGFVAGINSDVADLRAQVRLLQGSVADLQSALHMEQQAREVADSGLSERLSREIAAQVPPREALEKRQDEFESKTKQWIGSLGHECKSLKEQLSVQSSLLTALQEQQSASQAHIRELDAALQTKFAIAEGVVLEAKLSALKEEINRDRETAAGAVEKCRLDLEQNIASESAAVRVEVERNHATAAAALEVCDAKIDREVGTLSAKIDAAVKQGIADKTELVTDIAARHERLEAQAKSFVKQCQLDLEAVDSRTAVVIQSVQQELQAKAAGITTTVNSISDRLTKLTMDVNTNLARAEAAEAKIAGDVELVNRGVAKSVRQLETEREHWNSCFVAIEKAVAERKVEAEGLGTRLTSLEAAVSPLPTLIATKAHMDEVAKQAAATHALQQAVAKAANLDDTAKIELSVLEQRQRIDNMQTQASEREVAATEKAQKELQKTEERFATVDGRISEVKEEIKGKPDMSQTDRMVKEVTERMLKEFYCKQEIDAQISRVWWRIGDGKPWMGTPTGGK